MGVQRYSGCPEGHQLSLIHICLETYSPYQNADLTDFDIFDSGERELCFGSSESARADIEARAEEILQDGKFPLLLGGEPVSYTHL